MNFSAPSKPIKPVIPLWHPSLIEQRVKQFRTRGSLDYFSAYDRVDAGVFVVNAISRDGTNSGYIWEVSYP